MKLLTTCQLMPSQSPSSGQPTHPTPWPTLPIFIALHNAVWYRIYLLPVWVSCPSYVNFPGSCAPPAFSMAGQYVKLKGPWFSVSTAQKQLKHQCGVSIILILNPDHSTIPATRKKINFIPSETTTMRGKDSKEIFSLCLW